MTELAYDPAADSVGALPVDTLRPSTGRPVGHDGDLCTCPPRCPPVGRTLPCCRTAPTEWTALPDPPGPLDLAPTSSERPDRVTSPGPTSGSPEVLVAAPPAAVFDTSTGRWLDPHHCRSMPCLPPEPMLGRLGVVAGPRLIAVSGLLLDLDTTSWSALPRRRTSQRRARPLHGWATPWSVGRRVRRRRSAPPAPPGRPVRWRTPSPQTAPTPTGGRRCPTVRCRRSTSRSPRPWATRVLIMGGGPACPASADCGPPSFDGSTARRPMALRPIPWRSIAPIPHTVDEARTVTLDGRL